MKEPKDIKEAREKVRAKIKARKLEDRAWAEEEAKHTIKIFVRNLLLSPFVLAGAVIGAILYVSIGLVVLFVFGTLVVMFFEWLSA